jgi:hypothetical protein
MDATDMHVTIEELLEEMFSVPSVPRVYNEGQLPLEKSWDGCEKSRRLVWHGRQPGRGVELAGEWVSYRAAGVQSLWAVAVKLAAEARDSPPLEAITRTLVKTLHTEKT